MYDVIVVGLGPGGISLLKSLENSNLKVLAVEREIFPKKKPCAGGLTPKAYSILKEKFPEIDRVVRERAYEFFLYNGNREVVLSSRRVLTYLTDRAELDHFLFSSLNHSKFNLHLSESALSVEIGEGRVKLKTDKDSYVGRVLVDSSGVNSRIARQLNVNREIGFTYERDLEVRKNELIVDFSNFNWGYYWVFPKGEWVTSGLGEFKKWSNLRGKLIEFERKHGIYGNVLWESGFPIPAGKRKNDVLRKNVLFVGDSGGLVDPLTGEGIFYAARSGILAGECLKRFFEKSDADELKNYKRRIDREFGGEFFWARVVGKLFFSFRNANLSLVERSEKIADLTAELLSGEVPYRKALMRYAGILLRAPFRR